MALLSCDKCFGRKTRCDRRPEGCGFCLSRKLECTYKRTRKRCLRRRNPNPTNQEQWSQCETQRLLALRRCNDNWSAIARQLHNRTEGACEQQYRKICKLNGKSNKTLELGRLLAGDPQNRVPQIPMGHREITYRQDYSHSPVSPLTTSQLRPPTTLSSAIPRWFSETIPSPIEPDTFPTGPRGPGHILTSQHNSAAISVTPVNMGRLDASGWSKTKTLAGVPSTSHLPSMADVWQSGSLEARTQSNNGARCSAPLRFTSSNASQISQEEYGWLKQICEGLITQERKRLPPLWGQPRKDIQRLAEVNTHPNASRIHVIQ